MKNTTISLLVLAMAMPVSQANAAQSIVNWGAAIDNGIGDHLGNPLPIGSLVELGGFDVSNTAIASSINSPTSIATLLSTHFRQFGYSSIGTNVGDLAGYWQDSASGFANTSTPFALNGKPIYILAFNAPTVGAATQFGIFTSNNPALVFPNDNNFPFNSITVDLDQMNIIDWGGFGTGSTPPAAIAAGAAAAPLFNVGGYGLELDGQPVVQYPIYLPEPSTWAGLAGGMALAGAWIARRRGWFKRLG